MPAKMQAGSQRSASTSRWIDLTLEVPFVVMIKFAPLASEMPTHVPLYHRGCDFPTLLISANLQCTVSPNSANFTFTCDPVAAWYAVVPHVLRWNRDKM